MNLDLINASFELFGGVAILMSANKCYQNKSADGISWVMTAFFFIWGIFNLFFYPSLGQNLSFYAAVFMVACNIAYTSLIIKYSYFVVAQEG